MGLIAFRRSVASSLLALGLLILGLTLAGFSAWGFDDEDDEAMPMVEVDLLEEDFDSPEELQPPEEAPARPRARPRRRGVSEADSEDSGRSGAPALPPPPAYNRASERRQNPGSRFRSSNRANTSSFSNIKFKATGEKRKYPPRPNRQATRDSQGK